MLDPRVTLRPAIVQVPVALGSIRADHPRRIIADPGYGHHEIDRDAGALIVHALDVDDTDQLITLIQTRYEAALREVFAC